MTAAELAERVATSLNEGLGPIMARPERMESALAGRKRLCAQLARAAILKTLAAIREPTEAMLKSTTHDELTKHIVWRAMIDALAAEIREGM